MSSRARLGKAAGAASPVPAKPRPWDELASPHALAVGFFAAVLLFYAKPLLDANASIQWDAVDVHYSAQKFFASRLFSGLPFWTPYLFSGFPFLADPQTGAWYPLNWPFFLSGITPRSIEWELALHCLLALTGCYCLARALAANRGAAALGGVFFAFSGFFAGHSAHVGMLQTAALLPWLLWAGLRAASSLRHLPVLLAIAGCVVLPGHFQTALYCFFSLALLLAAVSILRRAPWRRTILVAAAAALAAFALSAVMILPGLELSGQSIRASADFTHMDEGSLVPGALVTLLDADYYGAPEGQNYSGPTDITQFFFYQGLLLLPLALWGVATSARRWFGLALLVPALWYAFGRRMGFYLLVSLLPGFKSIRAPVHIWFVAALGLALLAAAGLDSLRTRFRSPWVLVAVLLFSGADLYYWNMDHNVLAYARASFQDQYGNAEDHFKSAAKATMHGPLDRLYAPFDSPGFGPLNGSLDNQLEVTYGYNPLALVRYTKYLDAAKSNPKLLDSLSVTARLNASNGLFELNQAALPRIFAPASATAVRSREEAAGRLGSLDPSRETVVENLETSLPANAAVTVHITSYDGDRYVARYQADRPTLLRAAIPYFPGWRAEIDGRPVKLLPADLALIGVVAPAGDHTLVLHYHSNYFAAGALVSLAAWAAVLAWLIVGWKAASKE